MITEEAEISSEWWARATVAVQRRLTARGISRADAEDAVQEASARALASDLDFSSEEHLRRWLTTVAVRVSIDAHRKARLLTPLKADLSGSDGSDPAAIVEQRESAERVLAALHSLRARDREALLSVEEAADRPTAVRNNVRRHRARKRLLTLLEGVLGWWLWLRHLGSRPARAAATLTPALAVLVLVIGLPVGPTDHAPTQLELAPEVTSAGAPRDSGASPPSVAEHLDAAGDAGGANLDAAADAGGAHLAAAAGDTPPVTSPAPTLPDKFVVFDLPTPTGGSATGTYRDGDHEPIVCIRYGPGNAACIDVEPPPAQSPQVPPGAERVLPRGQPGLA